MTKDNLTDRERRLLLFVSIGYNFEEIQSKLCISRSSVFRALRSAVGKLGASNTTHAVAIALRRGDIN